MRRKLSKAAAAGGAAALAVGLGVATAGTAAAAPAWTSAGPARVSGTVTALTTVQHAGVVYQWAFQTTANEVASGYPSVWSRAGGGAWAKAALPGSKPGEVFTAAGAVGQADVLAFTRLPGSGGREWRFNGRTWSVIKTFPAQIGGATVLNDRNVFVYGNNQGGHLGVYHYDGTTWTQIAATLVGGSATSASDAWAFNGTTVGHWNGQAWTGTDLASLINGTGAKRIVDVLSAGGTVYAVGVGEAGRGEVTVLTYNGHAWAKTSAHVKAGTGDAARQEISADGDGGVWVPLTTGQDSTILVHYLNRTKTWATVTVPGTIQSIWRLPGTTGQLAGGYTPSGLANPSTYAEIESYR